MLTTRMFRGKPVTRNLLVAAFAVTMLAMHTMASAIEEPKFAVTQQLPGGVEVREYAPYLAAEVVVSGPAGDASSKGFKILAAYIFGKNKGERKISMTAPVKQAAAGPKIEMAAPVTQTAVDGGYAVQFVMPAEFSLETLPEPIDPAVQIKAVPAERVAVIRYSGFWSQSNYDHHLNTLRSTLNAASLKVTGEPVYSRYDPPWTPWFLRRNEIWLKLV